MLHLHDYPPFLFRKLKSKYCQSSLAWNGYPPHALGFLLRPFLHCKRGTEGGGGGIVDDPALKLGSKRRVGLVTDMGNVA